jgi:hypothetical protein
MLFALALPCIPGHASARLEVGRFSVADLEGWQAKAFKGETLYELRDGALCAESEAAASGRFREIAVDLQQTPWLNWSWKLERALAAGDEQSKGGDDYAARVYVVFSGGVAFWRTRAINYVWSAAQPEGTIWPNAFTANARMLAIRSGSAQLGEWVSERRDVRADYRRLFGSEPGVVAAVAIMTDTDNAGGSAGACYGDIWFAGE